MPRKKFKRLLTFPEVMEESRCPKMVILELRNLPDTNDELPTKKVSLDLWKEMSTTMDEAKLRKVVNEINLSLTTSTKAHSSHSKLQRDPKAPALSPVNQDLLYLKKGKSGPEKIMMSLHKFHANLHAKIFYIKKQKEPGKSKEAVHSNSKIVQIIKTYWELGHEHKFVTEIIARRANGSIVDDYAETGLLWSLLVFIRSIMIWERVHDFQLGVESYQQKVNLTAPKITFSGIEKYKMFSIIFEPVYGIIYKNNKKEKRVMRHQEVHKF
ncbi:hypothetical protein Tco_1555500 [Tanacetum coccineum]